MQAFFVRRLGAFPAAGFSGEPRMSARPFWVGVASDASDSSFLRQRRVIWVRKHEFEACAGRLDRFVDQIATLGPRKRLRNREAEPCALCGPSRVLAPRESLEQLRDEFGIDSRAAVLDSEPEMPVATLGTNL